MKTRVIAGLLVLAGAIGIAAQDTSVENIPYSPLQATLVEARESGVTITMIDPAAPPAGPTPAGILVWRSAFGRERWAVLQPGGAWPRDDGSHPEPAALIAATRSAAQRGLGGPNPEVTFGTTIQLDRLDGATVVRQGVFVTPRDQSDVLSRRPTLRRLAGGGKLTACTVSLIAADADQPLIRVPFAEGQAEVVLSKWDWPKALAEGLPPGTYTIRVDGAVVSQQFTIVDTAHKAAVWEPVEDVERLAGADNPISLVFAAQHLLSFCDDEGLPRYLGDVLDLLDAASAPRSVESVTLTRELVRGWLENLARDPGYRQARVTAMPSGSPTGIAEIDEVRGLIASGRWIDALSQLDAIDVRERASPSPRLRGLSALYRGVVLSEAGAMNSDDALAQFRRAAPLLEELAATPAGQADLLRLANNRANLHLLVAQNGLSNHAFQMAAGIDLPISTCLEHLRNAQADYERSLNLAVEGRDARAADAVRINLARVQSVLADLFQSLDVPAADGTVRFAQGPRVATLQAWHWIAPVLAAGSGADVATRGAAWGLRSELAYRRGDWDSTLETARAAEREFQVSGDLAGIETLERLRGLVALRQGDRPEARRHFLLAMRLAELHRSQYPQGTSGQSRAGYFARHSFVCEQLVELALQDQQPLQALQFMEQARARAAQDLLSALGVGDSGEPLSPRSIASILADWPKDTTAVEYFLGTEHAWCFVIRAGSVRAFPIVDSAGQLVTSRQLLGEARALLDDTREQADRMKGRLFGGLGFDHSWQDRSRALRQKLLPDSLLAELRETPRVIVVPQHLLHYVPFAGLVTQRDAVERPAEDMVSPRFVIDEPFSILVTPSLTTWDLIRRRPPVESDDVQAIGIVQAPEARRLPGVARDLENLRETYGGRLKTVLTEQDATEGRAKELLEAPGTLMVATHGFNDPDRPARSYLLMYPGPLSGPDEARILSGDINDGRLTAREIYQLRIPARLVVLSACFSGLGDRSPEPGDDVFGLQRAFLAAGARTVLSGLWDIYDGTAPLLMMLFHEQVRAGRAPSEALAVSQREFLNAIRKRPGPQPWIHPYFWAVFGVAGAD